MEKEGLSNELNHSNPCSPGHWLLKQCACENESCQRKRYGKIYTTGGNIFSTLNNNNNTTIYKAP